MNLRSLLAARQSSEVAVRTHAATYDGLYAATQAALLAEGVTLQGQLVKQDEQEAAQRLDEQQAKAVAEADANERDHQLRLNGKFILDAVGLFPKTGEHEHLRKAFVTEDARQFFGVAASTVWLRSLIISPGRHNLRGIYPYYAIGYNFKEKAGLLVPANSAAGESIQPENRYEHPEYGDYRAEDSLYTINRPAGKKIRQSFMDIMLDNVSPDIELLKTSVSTKDRAWLIDEDLEGLFPSYQTTYDQVLPPVTIVGNKQKGEDLKVDIGVIARFDVIHNLARLAARFGVGEQYLGQIDAVIESETARLATHDADAAKAPSLAEMLDFAKQQGLHISVPPQ